MPSQQFRGLFNSREQEFEPEIQRLAASYRDNRANQLIKNEYLQMICKYVDILMSKSEYQKAKPYLITALKLAEKQHDVLFFITGSLLKIKENEVFFAAKP